MSNLLENENIQHQILLSICSGLGKVTVIREELDGDGDGYANGNGNGNGNGNVDHRSSRESYELGVETLDCLKDLKKLLKMDVSTPEKGILKKLGSWNIVKNHLVPLFLHHARGKHVLMASPSSTVQPSSGAPQEHVLLMPLSDDKSSSLGSDISHLNSAPKSSEDPAYVSQSMAAASGNDISVSIDREKTDPPMMEERYVYIMSGKNKSYAKLVLEILVALTWPHEYSCSDVDDADALASSSLQYGRNGFRQEFPMYALEYLTAYKEELASVEFQGALLDIWIHALTQSRRKKENQEYAVNIIQLSIFLIRNCLLIPDKSAGVIGRTLSDTFIKNLGKSRLFSLCLSLCSEMADEKYSEWALVMLELFSALFYGKDPIDIIGVLSAGRHVNRHQAEISGTLKDLLLFEKNAAARPNLLKRHAKFGGVFDIKLSTGQNILVSENKALAISGDIDLDQKKKGKFWRRAGFSDLDYTKKCGDDVSLAKAFVHFGKQFLESAFNGLMTSVFAEIRHHRQSSSRDGVSEQDHFRFVWLARFFFKFYLNLSVVDREHIGGIKILYSLFTKDFTRYLVNRIAMFYGEEGELTTSQSQSALYLHCFVECFKEFLKLLAEHSETQVSEHLQSNIYYDHERLQMLVFLTKEFAATKHSIGYLTSLIELNHVLLKIMEVYSNSKDGSFQTFRRRKQKTKGGDDDDGQGQHQQLIEQETRLSFEKFQSYFLNDAIVDKYVYYLEYLCHQLSLRNGNDLHMARYITKMFHRIFVACKMEPLFYKLSTFITFQRILTFRRQHEKPLKDICAFIDFALSKFFKKWSEYPLLMMELFFPKSARDVKRIIDSNKKDEDTEGEAYLEDRPADAAVEGNVDLGLNLTDKGYISYQKMLLKDSTLLDDWNDNVRLMLSTMCRFKKQNMIHWLASMLKQTVKQRKESHTLGLDFGDGDQFHGTDRIISKDSYPEFAQFFRDPLFIQLLNLLLDAGQEGHWTISSETTIDQLENCLSIITPYLENATPQDPSIDKLLDSALSSDSDGDSLIHLKFQKEKAPSKSQARKIAKLAHGTTPEELASKRKIKPKSAAAASKKRVPAAADNSSSDDNIRSCKLESLASKQSSTCESSFQSDHLESASDSEASSTLRPIRRLKRSVIDDDMSDQENNTINSLNLLKKNQFLIEDDDF